MMDRLACCLVIASLAFAAPQPATGTTLDTDTYDAVDAILMFTTGFDVTGVVTGDHAPQTRFYGAGDQGARATCERFALLAMSKPGKFQFVITNTGGNPVNCKLVLRTP